MSFIPPRLDFFVSHLTRSMTHFSSETKRSLLERDIKQLAQRNLKFLTEQLSSCLESSTVEALLGSKAYEWISLFIFELNKGAEQGGPREKALAEEGKCLLQEIKDFAELCLHKDEVYEEGLDTFLDEKWAFDEFKLLLENGEKSAVRHLEKLLVSAHPKALEIALELGCKNKKILKIFLSVVEMPTIEGALARLLIQHYTPSSNPEMLDVFKTLELLIPYVCSENLCQCLIQHLELNPFSPAVKILTGLMDHAQTTSEIYQQLSEILKKAPKWGASFFEALFSSLKSPLKWPSHPLFRHLIEESFQNEDLQMTLVAISAVLMPNALFIDAIELELMSLESDLFSVQLFRVHLRAARRHTAQLLEAEKSSGLEDPFNWSSLSLEYKFQVMQALILRVNRLVHFFNHDLKPATQKDHPVLDAFPKAKAIMIGAGRRTLPIIHQLTRSFDELSMPMVCMTRRSEEGLETLRDMPQVQLVEGELKPEIWLRDPLFCHEKSFKLPAFFNYTGEIEVEAKFHHLQRTHIPPAFKIMSAVAVAQKQLKMMEYLLEAQKKGLFVDKEIAFNFLYNEGGNCLRGSSKGRSYLIVGKDVLGVNRRALQRELDELGLVIEGNHLVRFVEPNLAPELPVKAGIEGDEKRFLKESRELDTKHFCEVSDHLMLELLALDAEVDDIFPAEQCEYHMDVSSLIVDAENKIVVVNDSVEALDLMGKTAETKIRNHPELETIPAENHESFIEKELAKIRGRANYFKKKMVSQKAHEDLTAESLSKQGFTVIRIPGCLYQLEKEACEAHQANFFNMISFENEGGEKCLLVLGCDESYREAFGQVMGGVIPHLEELKIYFAPEESSKTLLKGGGGLHCIMQVVK